MKYLSKILHEENANFLLIYYKGPFIYYVITFLGFLDPPPPYVSMFLVLRISKNWHFLTPLPPTSAYVIYEWSQGIIEPALQVPGKKTIAPCHTYRTYITRAHCPSLICYLGKKSVSGIVKHCTESAPHSAVQWCSVCLEIVIFDYQLESYCIGLLQQRKYMTG